MNKRFLLIAISSLMLIGCAKPNGGASSSVSSEEPVSSSESVVSSSEISSSESSTSSSSSEVGPTSYGYNHYNDYYGTLTWTDGNDLKEKLNTILHTGFHSLSYNDPNWETNSSADHAYDDFEYLDVIYSDENIVATATNKQWQREHAFPASLMTGSKTENAVKTLGRATDFHNLFASASSANSSRGNKNYAFADKTTPGYTNRTTNNGQDGYSFDPTVFEPGDIDKGRVARAIFYMCTMYTEDEFDSVNNITMKGLTIQEEDVVYPAQGVGYDAFAIGHLSDLLTWANTYEVDYLEMQHNESVYSHIYSRTNLAQNNRNPYVDYPELVDYVFGDKQDEAGDLQYLMPSSIALDLEETGTHHYAIQNAKRSYNYGESLSLNDLTIVSVSNDYSFTTFWGEYVHTLEGHTFSEEDGGSIEAIINVEGQRIKYSILLDAMENCNNVIHLDKGTLSNNSSRIGSDQDVVYDGVHITYNVTAQNTNANWYLANINGGADGFTLGSGTNPVTKVTVKVANAHTFDEAYIKAKVNNVNSSYTIKIYVEDTQVFSGVVNDKNNWKSFGGSFEPIFGKVTFVFEGANAFCLNSLAFNEVI